MFLLTTLSLLFLAVQSILAGDLSPKEIILKALEKDSLNFKKAKDYTFTEQIKETKLDNKDDTRSVETTNSDVIFLYGQPFRKKIAKNGKPLSPEEQKKVQKEMDRKIAKYAKETESQRAKRLAAYEKEREKERAFVKEIANAYSFTLKPSEIINGRPVYVIYAEPIKEFLPENRDAELLTKIRPRFWIDQQDFEWTKIEGDVIDTVSFGWILARLSPGSSFRLEQKKLNDEIWLPSRETIKINARLALLKKFNEEIEIRYSGYRKFSTESRIVNTADQPAAAPSEPK